MRITPTVIQHSLYSFSCPFEPRSWDLQSTRWGVYCIDFIHSWALDPFPSMIFQPTLYLTLWLADPQYYPMTSHNQKR